MTLINTIKPLSPLFLVLFLLTACPAHKLYTLPDPAPSETWSHHSLSPSDTPESTPSHFESVVTAVDEFLDALETENFPMAYRQLSNETRILLDNLSPTGLGESVLENGSIDREGESFTILPVDLFVIADFEQLLDEQPGLQENETTRRKEVYAVSQDSSVHHLVLIYEEDAWRIHRTDIDLTPGAPGRRALDD
jgi:hypothetical protein